MGRPLKIQKYGPEQGITYPTSTTVNQPAGAVAIDQGYPDFGDVTNPVYPVTFTTSQFFGVVGGLRTTATTATYPVLKVRVNITNSSSGEADGVIIRQKGAHKYLVATSASIDPENAVVGVALRISALGDTDWQAMGAPVGAAVGTIFTATAASGAGTTGTAQEVGVCVLTSDLTPGAGLMSISYFANNDPSTEIAVSRLTNKFLNNWTNFANEDGTSLTTYADGGNNVGVVDYSGEGVLLNNFFDDTGTAIKSGTAQTTIDLAQLENYTS